MLVQRRLDILDFCKHRSVCCEVRGERLFIVTIVNAIVVIIDFSEGSLFSDIHNILPSGQIPE